MTMVDAQVRNDVLSDARPAAEIAYFSMEIALEPHIPTYSGGLGVLAGDTLRAAADLGIPMIGVTLVHRKGYFRQRLDAGGNQSEEPAAWSPEELLEPLSPRVCVQVGGRPIQVRAWRYVLRGVSGHLVPVYLLDTTLPENDPAARALTDTLYGGDDRYRLSQEAILGLGGIAVLRALGYSGVQTYHLNEGHAALIGVALLEEELQRQGGHTVTAEDREAVRRQCVFTTHTPVPAGHDQFSLGLAREVLGAERVAALDAAECHPQGLMNMTYVALLLSRYVNGVALHHGEVSQHMFPHYRINAITNGVHAATWITEPFRELYDRHFPEWRRDNLYLRYAVALPLDEIREAHATAKGNLLAEVERLTGIHLDPAALTVGFARRATPYKRGDLLFSDLERLRRIDREIGPLQFVYAGKAHPRDEGGKALIRRVYEAAGQLRDDVPIVYLEEYDMALGRQLCAGVDVWLNTPQRPLEASGTSGMKAALNGVPSLSVLDGWWIEGHVEGVTGWAIGDGSETEGDSSREAASLYEKLETVIAPLYYGRPTDFAAIMRSAIALNGSFFNTQRMLSQYVMNAYRAERLAEESGKAAP